MAARENQGLLIAVILLVLLFLASAIAAFFGIQKAGEYADDLDQMKTDLASARDSSQAYQIQSQILQAYIGFKEGGTLSEANQNLTALDNMGEKVREIRDLTYALADQYNSDVQKFASNAGGEDQPTNTYRTLLENGAIVLGRQYNAKSVLDRRVTNVERDRDTKLAAKQAEVDEAQNNYNESQATLAKNSEDYKIALQKLQEKLTDIQRTNKQINTAKAEAVDDLNDKLQLVNVANKDLNDLNLVLKKKVDFYEREVFENPDGRIIGVSPENKMVVVNLGSADGLRANRSFAVYSKQTTNFQKDQHKAKIVITRIRGAHQAEANITLENPEEPIITGDHILTAAWDPGFAIEFALSGMFDLDNDGNSDLSRVISSIEQNGGKVVAYHDENGEIVGKISESTRYFVKGNVPDPTDIVTKDSYEDITRAMKSLEDAAEEFSVQNIGTKKMLDWIGLRLSGKIERTDGRIGEQFRRRSPSDR